MYIFLYIKIMPKKLPEFMEYFFHDCLRNDPLFSYKPMFWGYGIYKSGKIFAIYVGPGEIYFKVWDNNRQDYVDVWSSCFEYEKQGKTMKLSYYLLPEELFENYDELMIWIDNSLSVASKTVKKTKKNPELDLKILKFLQTIPKGKVASYKIIADKFGVHPRKIASVMRYNKEPWTYPCYKVVADSGKISGYNTERWVSEKVEKLLSDGIEIKNNSIEKKYFID